ncbi:MAG: DNA glycosylase AlkZ-like family protein [Myxococcota bacterium]
MPPRRAPPAFAVDLARARAHWHRRAGLAAPGGSGPADVVARTAWPRTLGGVDVYLAVRARLPGMSRAALDEAVARRELQVVPAVRECIYVVPRAEAPLALKVAEESGRARAERDQRKAGILPGEVERVGEAVVAALAAGPLTTDQVRKALPPGVLRPLGEAGKKVGVSSALPAALRRLEYAGTVERLPGRFDSQRYAWRLCEGSPFDGADVPADGVERRARIARRFFSVAGPATAAHFAEWAALSDRDARASMDRAGLLPVAVDGFADEAWILEEDAASLREGPVGGDAVALLPFEDDYLVAHGGPRPLVDPRDHARPVPVWGNTRGTTLGDAKHVSIRALSVGDTLAGLWEYDPDAGEVVFATFRALAPAARERVAEAAHETGAFLREQLGHGRSFSLDTDDALRERCAIVRAMGR